MSGDPSDRDQADEEYRAALSRHAMRDVQPIYRQFLRRLKARDTVLYEEAVERYQSDIMESAEGGSDLLHRWIDYGVWLAGRISPGQLIAVDREGRAEKPSARPPLGPLLLHLPEASGERGIPIAVPAEPSAAQEATQQLLCG